MKKLILPFLFFTYSVNAQHAIGPERLGEMQSAKVLEKNTFQVEAGYLKEKEKNGDYLVQLPKITLRFGIARPLELRLNMIREDQYTIPETIVRDGFRPIEPGLKFLMLQSRDSSINISLLAHAGLPVISSGKHDPGKVYHKVRILLQGELNEHWDLNINAGTDWDAKEQHQAMMYGVSSEMELGSKFRTVAELLGHISEGHSPKSMVTAGLGYAFTQNIMADVNGGFGLNSHSPEYSFGFGLTFRIH